MLALELALENVVLHCDARALGIPAVGVAVLIGTNRVRELALLRPRYHSLQLWTTTVSDHLCSPRSLSCSTNTHLQNAFAAVDLATV